VAFADSSAVLVPARILRRVIKRDLGLGLMGGAAARQTSHVISVAALGAIVPLTELGRSSESPWPETVVLLAQPEPDELGDLPRGKVLTEFWRRLFRTRVQTELHRALDDRSLGARIEGIGGTEFEEARAVLRQDGLLAPAPTDAATYRAFAAVFLDLAVFAPAELATTFPAIEDHEAVRTVLAADVNAAALLAATRPAGALDPDLFRIMSAAGDGRLPRELTENGVAATKGGAPRRRDRRLIAAARAAGESGNSVRAAILWTRSARQLGAEAGKADRASARAALKQLANRLQKALFIRKGEAELWAGALTPLLRRAGSGFWSPEERLLFDLQKVCLDHERAAFHLDLWGWAISLGKRPLKRPMPHLREVTMSNHLRSAARRMPKLQLSREDRARLEGLIRPAVHRAEEALREMFRPAIVATLEATWARPRDLPERVAYRKLVEEMLDQVVHRGFTTLGDLRDAASRSNLKMPDLAGPGEFFRGDRLLAADRALADRLEGVHRRGEVYLRVLQRLSALAFGTPVGRFLTLYAALPYGGSFVLLKGLEELDHLVISRLTRVQIHPVNPWSILLLGTVALGAINFMRFRRDFLAVMAVVGRSLRTVFLDLPARLLSADWLHRLLKSAVVVAVWRLVLKPALLALPAWAAAMLAGLGPANAAGAAVAVFFSACFLFDTDPGRALEEAAAENLGRAFRVLAFDVLPGLFRLIMAAFERLLEWIEKLIYAVDEWLRFRNGQSRAALAAKAGIGLVWGVVAYLVRFYVNLLIEPQVNPIKHFPVVTVSHKVILPLSVHLTRIAAAPLTPFLGTDLATVVAAANVLLLPGVFGFLVWELKSNWRLYEVNRHGALGPVIVGSHGETVVGLLRPAFHSGTLPKSYAKLRRARRDGREKAALKRREALHHVEESVRRFIERDFAALLDQSRALGRASVRPGAIRLATNRIRVELLLGEQAVPSLWLDLEERPDGLAAGVSKPGWLATLGPDPRRTLEDAVVGLFKMSGVEIVRPPGLPVEVDRAEPPASDRFADVVVTWREWVAAWSGEGSGERSSPGLARGRSILPGPESRSSSTSREPRPASLRASNNSLSPPYEGGEYC
jgi:hypothetical protein